MGGIATLAFAAQNPKLARAIVVIDVAVVSTRRRDRHVLRLRALPTIEFESVAPPPEAGAKLRSTSAASTARRCLIDLSNPASNLMSVTARNDSALRGGTELARLHELA